MGNDDQRILDVITEYSQDIKSFTGSIWDASDKHFANVASYVKRRVPEGWLPEQAQPLPPPPPPQIVSSSYVYRLGDWISNHRTLTAVFVAFFSTGGFMIWREQKKYKAKRRAPRASNGARKEVVVVAGPPSSPITRSLSLDLERRGFIVYIVCSNMDEEQQVVSEAKADIRSLHLDVADTYGTEIAMKCFTEMLSREQVAFTGAEPHNLHLRGVVMVPDLTLPSGPIETISPELWSDVLNAKVLNPIAVTQVLLPIICDYKSRVMLLTPSIVASLRAPFHSVETTIVQALEGFMATLRGELGTLGIDVIQFHLGAFDCTNVGPKHHLELHRRAAGSPDAWPTTTKAMYANNFANHTRVAQKCGAINRAGSSGSSLRELHNAVFDALIDDRPSKVWRVGRGSVAYDIVGKLPSGLVGWMMGLRSVSVDSTPTPALAPKAEDGVQSPWETV